MYNYLIFFCVFNRKNNIIKKIPIASYYFLLFILSQVSKNTGQINISYKKYKKINRLKSDYKNIAWIKKQVKILNNIVLCLYNKDKKTPLLSKNIKFNRFNMDFVISPVVLGVIPTINDHLHFMFINRFKFNNYWALTFMLWFQIMFDSKQYEINSHQLVCQFYIEWTDFCRSFGLAFPDRFFENKEFINNKQSIFRGIRTLSMVIGINYYVININNVDSYKLNSSLINCSLIRIKELTLS